MEAGEPMAVFYADKEELFAAAELRYQAAVTIEDEKANETPLVYARVTKDQVETPCIAMCIKKLRKENVMTEKEIMRHVDHTQLKAFATWEDIKKLCDEAVEYQTASVCIPPCYIQRVKEAYGEQINICTVVGFPLGYSVTEAKIAETKKALETVRLRSTWSSIFQM